jgi:hypothetical protein
VAVHLSPGFSPGETVALRPGLALPDWSLAPDPQARAALAASMAVAGRRDKWAGLGEAEDAARRAVLHSLASHGAVPLTAPAGADLAVLLRALQRRDLLVLDAAGAVTAAYPFSALPTPHAVTLGDPARPAVHALCAIDALGAGGMLGVDSLIRSRCAECGAAIAIRTCDAGHALAAVEPAGALVWSGIRYAGGCAATSGCALKPFFCSGAHLEAWRARTDPDGPGYRLAPAAALQAGLALFVPMLRPVSRC